MNGIYSVIYSPKATEDLKEIYSYIAFTLLAPDTAKSQVDRIRKKIRSLDFIPSRNPLVDWEPWKSMGMHKVPIDNFVIFYTVDESPPAVTVIRIVYGRRDIENIATDSENERDDASH